MAGDSFTEGIIPVTSAAGFGAVRIRHLGAQAFT